MRAKTNIVPIMTTFLLTTALFTVWPGSSYGQSTPDATPDTMSAKRNAKNASGFKEFSDHVQAYLSLRKSAESSLPALKPTALPEMITAHQQALARKIREARANAARGDIFSEDAREAFRHVVREELQGPHGHRARRTIQQGEPLKSVRLHVNEPYPDGVPFTTVPPALLLKFPKLPEQVAYRIVVRDLVLLDSEANLVLDRIPGIFPETM